MQGKGTPTLEHYALNHSARGREALRGWELVHLNVAHSWSGDCVKGTITLHNTAGLTGPVKGILLANALLSEDISVLMMVAFGRVAYSVQRAKGAE